MPEPDEFPIHMYTDNLVSVIADVISSVKMSLIEKVRKYPSPEILADMTKEEQFFLVGYLSFGRNVRLACFEQLAKGIDNTQDQSEKESLWLGALLHWGASLEDLGAWCIAIQKATELNKHKPVLHTLLTYRGYETFLDTLLMQVTSVKEFINKIGLDETTFQSMRRFNLIDQGIEPNLTYQDVTNWLGDFFTKLRNVHGTDSRIRKSYNQLKHGMIVGRWKKEGVDQDNPTIYQLNDKLSIASQIVEYKPGYLQILRRDIQNISLIISSLIIGYILKKHPSMVIQNDTGFILRAAQPK